MRSLFMDASLVLGVVSVALALGLFSLYHRLYGATRTSFGLALIVFAGAFMAQTGRIVYSYWAQMPIIPDSFAPFRFGIGLCETAGLGAMLFTASR
jgi:hypothetical protein